jgi:hypothetical protein
MHVFEEPFVSFGFLNKKKKGKNEDLPGLANLVKEREKFFWRKKSRDEKERGDPLIAPRFWIGYH